MPIYSSNQNIFERASRFDKSISFSDRQSDLIASKRLTSSNFSSSALFKNLAEGKPSLFFDYPKPYTEAVDKNNSQQHTVDFLLNMDEPFRYKINRELGLEPVRLTIPELIQRWLQDEETLRVTNIHTRKTNIPEILDPDAMCPFNLLKNGNPHVESLEMMTLMVGTTGSITESHSDDADVNNHCIVGKKLWLYWDALDGVKTGIEDNERQLVRGKPRFDLDVFLSLDSCGWCLVEEGDTLFLPGSYAHKVLTLEKYLGVGGFFVTFPSILSAFSRWLPRHDVFHYKEPLYRERKGKEVAEIIEMSLLDTVCNTGSNVSSNKKLRDLWGFNYISRALEHWAEETEAELKNELQETNKFRFLSENLKKFA